MNITPDFSEATESAPIPAGTYKTRITGCEKKKSQAGNEYLAWKLTIFGAEGDAARQNNRPLFYNTMLSGKAAGRLKDIARAALGEVPQTWNTEEFIGKEIETVVIDRLQEDGSVSNFPDVKTVRALRN